MAITCQWCYACHAGSKKCLGGGFDVSLTPDVGVIREGYCKLCKETGFSGERRGRYKQK